MMMRIKQMARVALLGAFVATPWYPGADAAELYQPRSVEPTAYTYDSLEYYTIADDAAPSPSDTAQPAAEAPYAPAAVACRGPASSCGCSTCESTRCYGPLGRALFCCNQGDPWRLPQTCYMQCHDITVGGWMSAGVLANSRGNRDNGPLGFNDRNEFNLHQLWGYINKEANADELGWDWGGRIDYVFGVDGPDTQAFGDEDWDFGLDTSDTYGSAIPQMYGTLAWGDWELKAGHFYTLIGYEVVQAPENFFYSHSYTMIYGEPFTHTGALLSRKVGDRFTVHAGWTNGWDCGWRDRDSASMFLGGISTQISDRASLTWAVTTGRFGDGSYANDGELYMNSVVFEWNLTDRFTYILQHDLGINYALAGNDTEWYGINQYFLYQLNKCWATGMRFEWFRDDDGARVVAGNPGDYYELTAGLNWKPHANLTIRPELRYDWFEGTGRPYPGNRLNQFTGGFDVIATF